MAIATRLPPFDALRAIDVASIVELWFTPRVGSQTSSVQMLSDQANRASIEALKEKDELIAILKNTIAEKDRRCRDLELALALLRGSSSQETLDPDLAAQPSAGPPPDIPSMPPDPEPSAADAAPDASVDPMESDAELPEPDTGDVLYDDSWPDSPIPTRTVASPPPAAAPAEEGDRSLDAVIREQSTGLFEDHWLRPRTSLAIRKAQGGQNVTLTFYLPVLPNGSPKYMILKPNFADAVTLEVPRGSPVAFSCSVPSLPNFTPRINVEIDPEPKAGVDVRELGVVLVSVQAEIVSGGKRARVRRVIDDPGWT